MLGVRSPSSYSVNPRKLAKLREMLRKRPFNWKEWQEVADLHEKHGHKTKAEELRKEAVRRNSR